MKEIVEIIGAYEQALAAGKKTALATVVHVDGSSYRRPGARMLIAEDGSLTGAISGGCLEGDALRKALLVIMQQQAMLVTYDTSDEDDAIMGLGLGCQGIIQVLIEPIDEQQPNHPIALLKTIAQQRKKAALVTLFCLADKKNPQPGTCLLLQEGQSRIAATHELQHELLQAASAAIEQQQSSFRNYISTRQQVTAFTEFIPPAISLLVAGAGNDVMPLLQMAAVLGWKVTVMDGRPAYAKQDRFPAGCKVILARPAQVLEKVELDDRTAVVLMTHNYQYDLSLLRALLFRGLPYIGMLGPRKKLDRMQSDLANEGVTCTPEQLATVFSPVGLNIGAETAEEIALSILAEIKAVFSSTDAAPLKQYTTPIHNRAALTIEQMHVQEK